MCAEKKKGEENGDPFWSRILIFTIVVVWIAIVGGNWIGHYMIKAGIFSKRSAVQGGEFKLMKASKPKPWKQPVKVVEPTKPPVKDFEKPEIIEATATPGDKTKTPSPSPSASKKPKESPKPSPKASPTKKPSPKVSPTPKPTPKRSPKPKPSPTPRPSPTPKPSKKPSPRPSPTKTKPESTSGSYSIQCGVFGDRANAVDLVNKLKAKGHSATVARVGNKYKVYVGTYRDRKKAQDIKVKIQGDGFDSFIQEQ
ncbi:MAG: SPOR domain-containing protein [Candidatus Eremiobacteraeota bacterium]|nr:SPOR domain-containing protein [Candidatus Eremiobacteraeota bacterium]